MERRCIYPLNAAGNFYVEQGMCIACTAPEHEAPDLMSHDPAAHAGYHCYFKKQPETPEELERAIMAVAVGCRGAVRYGGTDAAVLQRLAGLGNANVCDHLSQ
jgi:ferredoxin